LIVVDASVIANAVGDDAEAGRRHRAVIAGADHVATPDLAYVETVAVLRCRWGAGDLTDARLEAAVADLLDLPLVAFGAASLIGRAIELRAAVSAYDAVYVALAEGLDAELVTADGRLARASGLRCRVRVVE